MMQRAEITEKNVRSALCQFIFPFALGRNNRRDLQRQLARDGFLPFRLNNLELENEFYGDRHRVSHEDMERYYLPFTNNVLFPHNEQDDAFQRYSRRFGICCTIDDGWGALPFRLLSVDVILCPFDVGFITVRTAPEPAELPYSRALEFASRFRMLQNRSERDERTVVRLGQTAYAETETFVFSELVPGMLKYLDRSELEETYFERLPFFVDERMYVQAYYQFEEEASIEPVDLYRAARIDGTDAEGRPYVSASSAPYIRRYYEEHAYERWGPDTFFVTDETAFVCVTNRSGAIAATLANHMYGEYYYGLLFNLFHKVVLLKLSNEYSHVRIEQNHEKIEELIRSITAFSAKYYFIEVVSQSQGKEIFIQLRKLLGNDELYVDVKRTLADLFKYQANATSKRSSYLLLVLTIYTVISGIFGMNQVIEDLKGPIDWSVMAKYSVFQYFALVITFSGIVVGIALGLRVAIRFGKDLAQRRRGTS